MLYQPLQENLTKEQRKALNRHIIDVLHDGSIKLEASDIFNAFTGRGGLHDVNFKDFDNYAKYADAKKLYEEGQFFTPDALVAQVIDVLQLEEDELICDPTCGKGSFFNHIPNLSRVYGNELDRNAFLVASHCFAEANLVQGNMLGYQPKYNFDVIVGNPPFALRWYDSSTENYRESQHVFIERCANWLKPGGLLAVIVPMSYLNDSMYDQANIKAVNSRYSFIGQVALESNAFASLGVKNFATKLVVLQKRSESLPTLLYNNDIFDTFYGLRDLIKKARENKKGQQQKLTLEAVKAKADDEQKSQLATITKLLFDIARSRNTKHKLAECKAMLEKWQTQRKPEKMGWEEWEKSRLTLPRIIDAYKLILKRQHLQERNEIRLVPCKYGFKFKGYNDATRGGTTVFQTSRLLNGEEVLPVGCGEEYKKLLAKKAQKLTYYQQDLSQLEPDSDLLKELAAIEINKVNGETFYLNSMQRYDLARLISRDYAYCAYAPGAGKTGLAFVWQKYKQSKRTFILAPAIAIRGTWQAFLKAQGTPFITLDKKVDLERLEQADSDTIALITIEQVKKQKRALKKYIKCLGYKITLVFDEADEICNYQTQQTQAVLAVFRKAKAKLLMTGTATRNNLNEFYPQLELLHNNSYLMPCEAPTLWSVDRKGEMQSKPNPFYGLPFPARRGQRIYSQAFSPRRPSVFGIAKNNQDVYNLEALDKLVSSTRISRTFKEVAGDDKYDLHQHIIPLAEEEQELQVKLLNEFYSLFQRYYTPTNDSRKDAGLRAVRQLRLLIEMCAHAHLFDDYEGKAQYSEKMHHTKKLVQKCKGQLVAIGVTRKNVWGKDYLQHWEDLLLSLGRPTFIIHGGMPVTKRMAIIAEYQASGDGILISTQDALKSSVNIPECKQVFIPMLQWNMSRMTQFYHRFVRLDMSEKTHIHFISHSRSIEVNLWGLLVNKERLNGVIKHGEHVSQKEMTEMLSLDMDAISELMAKEYDGEGKVKINWTQTMEA